MSKTSDEVFDATPEGDAPELKRVLGPKLLLLFIVGDILGAGVYAVTGTMAGTVINLREVFFTSPGQLPLVAALLCAFLAGPWVGRSAIQYQIAGGLMAIGVLLWLVTWLINGRTNRAAGPGADETA